MADRICSFEDCVKPAIARGWCRKHYNRWYKNGDPRVVKRVVGDEPRPECAVDGCHILMHSRGYCRVHYEKNRKYGTPEARQKRSPGDEPNICIVPDCGAVTNYREYCRIHYRRWRKTGDPLLTDIVGRPGDEIPSYHAMHRRVAHRKGKATIHFCAFCGFCADEWAYDHEDPNPQFSDEGNPYSLDMEHYIPLCHFCHRRFDAGHPRGG